MAAKINTAAATIATSQDAIDEDETIRREIPKISANGRYITLSKSTTCSERGVLDTKPKSSKNSASIITDRILYDNPEDVITPITEAYRLAHPDEVSEPTEFSAYIRDTDLKPEKNRNVWFSLPSIEEATEVLATIEAPAKIRKPVPVTKLPDKGKQKEGLLTEDDIPRLRQQWYEEFSNIFQGAREELPPLREVNHEINLIEDDKKYTYRLATCPIALRPQFYEKLNRYVNAGWWKEHPTSQAAPLMCIPKKDGRLRTVVDARQRNDNTVKDVTPLPDQEAIREDVARAKYRSKIDLADAYEQVRVEPRDVHKTVFSTIMGTYVSNVVQQGDCNAPATFQRLMTSIFRDVIGKTNHAYLDDVFSFTGTIEEHERCLRVVFTRLRENKLHLKWSKCELYAKRMECLGHVIDDNGIHPDVDKLQRIRDWRTPRNYHDIQRFVGLVNYVANFLPDITTYTAPLQSMTRNGTPFFWRPIHNRCFEMIKHICYKTPVIRPLDYSSTEHVWVICDASKTGVGSMYGQGPTWDQCRPAGFMSKKFTSAQQHYAVHELETLAILEALQKWEDKLVGIRFHVITDHKALEFFKTQSQLSHRQRRWMDYMSRFNFDITYVKGEYNKVADCLSRYYESDTGADVHEAHEFVQSDRIIDPEGEDLPMERLQEIKERRVEIRAMQANVTRKSKRLVEAQEQREEEAQELNQDPGEPADEVERPATATNEEEITLGDTLGIPAGGRVRALNDGDVEEDRRLLKAIKENYDKDPLTRIVLANPDNHKTYFRVTDGIIWTKNFRDQEVVCIPREKPLVTQILTKAHEVVGHYGEQRTCEYLRRWYWWPQMLKSTTLFCRTCEACQKAKVPNKQPVGKLHPLPVPKKPWESIGMDFVGPFPESRGFNYLWVVICRLISMVHLIPVRTTITANGLSWKYLREIVRLHGLPESIVSDRDSKFTSRWWKELHRILGAKLLMSTSFHPQTDGQSERAIRNVGQILRTVVRPDQTDWVDKIDLVEFAINSSISGTTGYAPFELAGGYMPSMIKEIRNDQSFAQGVKSFANTALMSLADAHDAIIEARTFQTERSNKRRRDEPKIAVGDSVYLSTKNLNLPKNRARKLCPKFIGPYKVEMANPETSNYTLELPIALQGRRIVPTFHVGLLRPYHPSCDAEFPNRTQPEPYDFGDPDEHEWFVDEIIGHRWSGPKQVEYQVRWSLGDTTWETHANCSKLAALDRYLELQGVTSHGKLPRHGSRKVGPNRT